MTLLWDITRSSGATLSLGNTKASIDNNAGSGQGGIRGNVGKSSGKWYYEVQIGLYDGICVGLTSSDGTFFPGLDAKGFSHNISGNFLNSGSGFTSNGGGGPGLNTSMRVGVKVNFGANTVEIISVDHPEGTDVGSLDWTGDTVYPSIGNGFGGGASHVCDGVIYGDLSDFVLTHDLSYLPWSPRVGANFFKLLH